MNFKPNNFILAQGEVLLSIGTVIMTNNHVLTTAEVLRFIPLDELRVYFSSEIPSISPDIRVVDHVFYNPNNENVAIVAARFRLGDLPIRPLQLGSLPGPGANCELYFFPFYINPLQTAQVTLRQTNCSLNNQWCGALDVSNICRGFGGAPVLCEGENHLSGFNFNDAVCNVPGTVTVPVVSLIDIADIREWINQIPRNY